MIKNSQKKGLSPVIATVLLVGIVIVIALIVFIWMRSLNKEAITKFDGQNIVTVCKEVTFDINYDGSTLMIKNTGNVPIYQLKVEAIKNGAHRTLTLGEGDLGEDTSWPAVGLNPGMSYTTAINTDSQKLKVIPVLVGITKDSTRKAHTCEEGDGKEIDL